jgi:7,8-dihydropterin-6-yl-methyl-4-(beta-D-ribofuranosyl)aminobenzene 5'-phosphate synthase
MMTRLCTSGRQRGSRGAQSDASSSLYIAERPAYGASITTPTSPVPIASAAVHRAPTATTVMPIDLTILFDNEPGRPDLESLWGFAALIEAHGRRVLFDSGSNGRVLLRNMRRLAIDPAGIDLIFLSHAHWDHIGGLDSMLELAPKATVVVHAGFSKHLVADLERLCARLIVVDEAPMELAPGLISTGMLPSEPPEHALIILGDHSADVALVTGCAHPGITELTARAAEVSGRPVTWAIGGFHLMYSDPTSIAATADALRSQGVQRLLATHCTGSAARGMLASRWGKGFIDAGLGRAIRLDPIH